MIAQLQTVPGWRSSHLSGGKGAARPVDMSDLHFIPGLRSECFLGLTSSSLTVGKLNWSRETDVFLAKSAKGTWRPIYLVCKGTGPGGVLVTWRCQQMGSNQRPSVPRTAHPHGDQTSRPPLSSPLCPVSLYQLQAHLTSYSA